MRSTAQPAASATADSDIVREGIDLAALLGLINRNRLLFSAAVLLCTAVSAAYAFMTTPVFRATAVLAFASESEKSSSFAAVASQLGGLASMAGFDLDSASSVKEEALATLRSRVLGQKFIADNQLLPVLFHDKWNEQAKQWDVPADEVPTLLAGYERLSKIMTASENKKTGLVSVAVEWHEPAVAAAWVKDIVRMANVYLRDQAIADSERNLANLQEQLKSATSVEVQQSIYRLMEIEIKKVMLARGNEESTFRVIDPAVVPERKIRPRRGMIIVSGFGVGLILGLFAVLVRARRLA